MILALLQTVTALGGGGGSTPNLGVFRVKLTLMGFWFGVDSTKKWKPKEQSLPTFVAFEGRGVQGGGVRDVRDAC